LAPVMIGVRSMVAHCCPISAPHGLGGHAIPILAGPICFAVSSVACADACAGVSQLLHTWELNTLGTFLYKIRNVAGEVLHRLINLEVVLPSGCRPDAIMVFLQPAQPPHP
jgi:hypothetical protein